MQRKAAGDSVPLVAVRNAYADSTEPSRYVEAWNGMPLLLVVRDSSEKVGVTRVASLEEE